MSTAQVNNVLQYSGINTAAVNSGASPIIPVPAIDNSGFVTIGGGISSSTGANYYMLTRFSGAGQYQVTGGLFYLSDLWIYNAGAQNQCQIGYGTAALGSDDTVTPPTGATYLFSSGNTVGNSALYSNQITFSWQKYSFPGVVFPLNAYPFFRPGNSSQAWTVIMTGIVK